jgi:acyl carrier protein
MEKAEIFETIKTIITPYSKNTEVLKNASDSTHFIDDLDINSARLVDIVIDMEDKFGIEIDDETADKIQTMGDAVALIEKATTAA